MKKLILLSSLATLISCGGSSSSGGSISDSININGPKLDFKHANSRNDEYIGKYTTSTISTLNIFSCLAKTMTIDLVSEIFDNIRESITKKKFKLVIPEDLSRKIFNNLREKAAYEKINPEKFWTILDKEIAKELNEFLVYKNLKKSDLEYADIQRQIALAMSLLVENGDFNIGYKVPLKSGYSEIKLSIAFSENASESTRLPVCESYSISSIEPSTSLLKPSDITTYMTCGDDDRSFKLEGYQNKILSLSLLRDEVQTSIEMLQGDLHYTKEKPKYVTIESRSNELKRFKLKLDHEINFDGEQRTYDSSSHESASIVIQEVGDKKINLRRLSCDVIKPLNLYLE